MKKPVCLAVLILSSCLLAGCTDGDWDHALNFVSPNREDAEAAPVVAPSPQPQAAVNAPATPADSASTAFCQGVATEDATRNDFDPATQKRVLAQSYAQCLTIYTR